MSVKDNDLSLEELLVDGSRMVIEMTAANIGNNPDLFKQIWKLTTSEKHQISPRASRVLHICALKHPSLFDPYESELINMLSSFKNESVLFNVVHLLADRELTKNEDDLGILADYCFETVVKSTTKPALKVYCLEVIYKITIKEPDLKQELIAIIEEQLPLSSAGFFSRGTKMLKKLYK